jgi:hypothetical protein
MLFRAQTYSSKTPLEAIDLGIGFYALLVRPGQVPQTLASGEVTITVESGTDPNPQAMLVGLPTINGAMITQRVSGGINGCVYRLSFQATTSTGQVFEEVAYLPLSET